MKVGNIAPRVSGVRLDRLEPGEFDGLFTASKVHGSAGPRFAIGDVQRVDDTARAGKAFLHPLVHTHPLTGRKGLYVSACPLTGVAGLADAEAAELIEQLFRQVVAPRFVSRVRWAAGLVVMIDNRCVQHYALNDYHGQRREIHRVPVSDDGAPSRKRLVGEAGALSC
ncbi:MULTISPECIES: TauD/TfdA family dioxygenase [Actinomycetes]|uniref:TauD/TfdA dioxygenase family protein n=1 Tax=Actinomycetes TaxID=1760 RepID=UPI0001B55A0C|nr:MULTISPECIES: TauD/TfdA family dioxygenase [Actinomycetes]